MARIRRLHEKGKGTRRKQTLVDCGWHIVEVDGETLVQLSTYGSDDRKDVGTASQVLQVDASIASELVKVLRSAFPDL